jgi:hypothetical protein
MSRSNLLRAGGYGRVGTTALIKAVLVLNRYVKILASSARASARMPWRLAGDHQNRAVSKRNQKFAGNLPASQLAAVAERPLA